MITGIELYDLNGAPLWNSTDININIVGVYTIDAGVSGAIPLPIELYHNNVTIRKRNNIPADEVANVNRMGSAGIARDGINVSATYNTVGCPSMVIEIHVR